MGVRENAKGTVLARRMSWPAHLLAIAMHLVAETIRTITGMIKRRKCRRRMNLTDCSSSAMSLVSQLTSVTVGVSCCIATNSQ